MTIVIVGPTAVGKTAASIALARRIGGEIVSADSRYVYRYMDIGTAKPTLAERGDVSHHLIDVVDPDEEYSVAHFLRDAPAAIDAIRSGGAEPIVVGGTGYWIRALLGGGTSAGVPPNPALRAELTALRAAEGTEPLLERLRQVDGAAAERVDVRNPRRLIRAIEVVEATGRPYAEALRRQPPGAPRARVFGLALPRDLLFERINARYDEMIAAGWIDEVRGLLERGYRRDLPSMSSIGYSELAAHLSGELTLDAALEAIRGRGRRLARNQFRWFPRDDRSIRWLDARGDVTGQIAAAAEQNRPARNARGETPRTSRAGGRNT